MAWVYLDDHFPEHPKVVRAGGDAAWLFVCGLAYVRRHGTKGLIPKGAVGQLTDRTKPAQLAKRLVEVNLWVDIDDEHFAVHNYDEWNRPQESRSEAARKAARARWDAKGNADASSRQSDTDAVADASTCPSPHPPSPTGSRSSSSEPLSAVDNEEDERFATTWTEYARMKCEEQIGKGQKIGNAPSYRRTVAANARSDGEMVAEARRISGMFPSITPTQLAQVLMGEKSVLRFLERVS